MLTPSITESTSRDSFNLVYNRDTTDGQKQRGAGIVPVVPEFLFFLLVIFRGEGFLINMFTLLVKAYMATLI